MGVNDENKPKKIKRNILKKTSEQKRVSEGDDKSNSILNNKTIEDKENKINIIKVDSQENTSIKHNKAIIVVIAGICIALCSIYLFTKSYDDLVYPSIKLYDSKVSKLDSNELNKKVDDTVNFIKTNIININIESKEYEIEVGELVSNYNEEKTKEEIISFGKDRNFLQKFGLITLSVQRNYNFDITLDDDALNKIVNEIYNDSTIEVVEPSIAINGDDISVKEGKNGKVIDKKKLKIEIIKAIQSNDIGKTTIYLNEEYKTIKPKTNIDDLKKINSKISSATTYFCGSSYNRCMNIANAADLINNTVLLPGEEFDYEKAVSPVSLDNGYYMAPVIVNGTHKNAPGGGVCQVSSTLYNAELKAGIIPTERYNHSKSVSYVQKGLDATLASGSKNLRFKNPYDYPILIHAYTSGNQITVEIWSKENLLNGKKYTPVSFINGNIANAYLYEYDKNGELIDKIFLDTSIYG